jgi:hypothetical protein
MVSRTSSYGLDIAAGEGTPLILAIAVAIDALTTETEAIHRTRPSRAGDRAPIHSVWMMPPAT